MNKSIGIIGYGVLGKAYAKAININMFIDLDNGNVELPELCEKARWILICVPTPPTKDGGCDTSIVEDWVKKISKENKNNVVVIRSTVIPGTAHKLMKQYKIPIISAPEFLTESTAEEDAMQPDLKVLGAKDEKLAEEFFTFQKKRRNNPTYDPHLIITDNMTAEFIKYSINSFYATKVTFANQIYDAASEHGADYDRVMEAMYKRKWIGDNHLRVFHKGKRGYAGKCLPKDVAAFTKYTESPLLKLVNKLNKKTLVKDNNEAWFKVLNGADPNNL